MNSFFFIVLFAYPMEAPPTSTLLIEKGSSAKVECNVPHGLVDSVHSVINNNKKTVTYVLSIGVVNNVEGKSVVEVEALLKSVTEEKWSAEEESCFKAMVAMLEGVRNSTLWATWMWDSNQRPMGTLYGLAYHLGNFDQCLNPPWLKEYPHLRPQYCVLDFQLSEGNLLKGRRYFDPYETANTYINTKSMRGRHMNAATWGLCLPSQCSANSVSTLGKMMAHNSHWVVMSDNPAVTVSYCHLAGEVRSYGLGARVFFGMMLCLLIIAIISTYSSKSNSNSFGAKVVQSFCLKANYATLFDVQRSEIPAMNGIRFLTSFFVAWAHIYMFSVGTGLVNALDVDKDAASATGIILHHLDLIVDTFFAFSGLLFTMSLLSAKPESPQNLIKLICKRYVRLVVGLAVVIFFMSAVSDDIDNGPLWRKFAVFEQSICAKTWWRCLLMLNTSAKEMCYLVAWYTSCDFQLTIVNTLIFYVYRKNNRNGLLVYGIVSLLSILIPGFLTYWYSLQPIITSTVQNIFRLRAIPSLDYVYVKTYSRGGSYIVGMAAGYFIRQFNREKYKKVIPKIWSFLATILAVSLMIFTLSLGTFFYDRAYNGLEAAISAAMDRVLWSFAVCVVVGICVYGDLPIINDFLSWSLFRPLGRLSYGIYLIHSLFLQQILFSNRVPMKYDHLAFFIIACGLVVVTSATSLFVWLTVEAPLNNLFNDLFIKTPQKKIEAVTPRGADQNCHKKVL